jgi:hypothetical protein
MLHVIEDDEEWNKVAEIASERLFYEEKNRWTKKAKVSNGTSTGGMLMRRIKSLCTSIMSVFWLIFGSLSYWPSFV